MKIYTHIVYTWNDALHRYVEDKEDTRWFEYEGLVALCCGASAAQNNILAGQQSAYSTMTQQASQVFGNDSAVFNDLQSTFAPTVAAGPSQQGFSAAENQNLISGAVTNTGQAYRNAKSAVGEAEAAQGGGNDASVTGGSKTATDLGVATSAAAQTAGEENQINEANYQTGRQNYDTAVNGLANATNVFNSATGLNNAATNAGQAAAGTANQIASQNNSWVQAVTGALGSIGGAAVSGAMKNLGGGSGGSGGGSSPSSGSSYDATDLGGQVD